jgi:hypothetical protein
MQAAAAVSEYVICEQAVKATRRIAFAIDSKRKTL